MKFRVARSFMWFSDTPAFSRTFFNASSSSPDKSKPFLASQPTCVTCLKFEGVPISALVSFFTLSRFLFLELLKSDGAWYGACTCGGANFAKTRRLPWETWQRECMRLAYWYWQGFSASQGLRRPICCCSHCSWWVVAELVALFSPFDDVALKVDKKKVSNEHNEQIESIKRRDYTWDPKNLFKPFRDNIKSSLERCGSRKRWLLAQSK